MEKTYKRIKESWEFRSQTYKDRIEGVLPKSFPEKANLYLDRWSFSLLSKIVNNKRNFQVLDLGCGYGRLSEKLLKKYSKIRIYGIDIAPNYINIFNRKLSPRGKAFLGDIRKLPFGDESMDAVFLVTTLMYIVDKKNQQSTFKEIFRVLKKGGKLLIIERDVWGYSLITFGGLVGKIRGNKNKEIKAVGFSPRNINALVEEHGGIIKRKLAIPFFTLSLPLIFVLNKISVNLLDRYLEAAGVLDHAFGSLLFPSIYIAYLGYKK